MRWRFLLLALMATGAGEYSREMLRKPYVIGRWMYSNGVRVPYVSKINAAGISGGFKLGVERVGNGTVELFARRGDLPRRVRIMPHARRVIGRWPICSRGAIVPTFTTSS